MKNLILLLSIFPLLNSCSTANKSAALGAGIGVGGGMALGAIIDPNADGQARTRNVILGGALGGLAGMTTGLLVHGGMEKAKAEGKREGLASAAPSPSNPPQLSQPRVETIWVDPKIVGNRYVEGHFEYLISEPARWQESR